MSLFAADAMSTMDTESASLEQVLQAVKDSQRILQRQLVDIVKLLESDTNFRGHSIMAERPEKQYQHSLNLGSNTMCNTYPSCNTLSSSTTELPCQDGSAGRPCSGQQGVLLHFRTNISDNTEHYVRSSGVAVGTLVTETKRTVLPGLSRQSLAHFIRGPQFDFLMGIVILVNSIYIGFEIDNSIHEKAEGAPLLQYVFVLVYSVELSLRFWAFGFKETLGSKWNLLDIMLVACGLISLFVIAPIRRAGNSEKAGETDPLEQLVLMRLLRLLRLVRSFRFFPQCKILWGLVNGLLHALPAILSTFALLFLLIYMFACGGVELITKSKALQDKALALQGAGDAKLKSILDNNFNSLPMVALTLMRFTTTDSIAGIYEPLTREKPELIFYWVLMLLVISITIMNLITAVLVEHSFAMAKNDSELETHLHRKTIRKLLPAIEDLFDQLDTDKDGKVSLEEAVNSHVLWPKELTQYVKDPSVLIDLFDAIDRDHSGSVDKDELVEGLLDFTLSDVPIETIKLLNFSRVQKRKLKKVNRQLDQLLASGMVLNNPSRLNPRIVREILQSDEMRISLASMLPGRHIGEMGVLGRESTEMAI